MAYGALRSRRWLRNVRRSAVTTVGARSVAVGALLLLGILALLFCWRRDVPALSSSLKRAIAMRFIWTYWADHWFGALLIAALLGTIGFSPAIEKLLRWRVEPVAIDVSDFDRDWRLKWFCGIATPVAGFLIYLTLPFVNITVRPLYLTAFYFAFVLATPLTYVLSLAWPHCRRPIGAISTFKFPRTPAFNVATIGATALEARWAKDVYHGRSADVVTPQLSRELMEGGELRAIGWNGFDAFFERLGEFVPVPPETITLHHNTTAAIRAALQYSAGSSHVCCVHTDLEYPSVIDAIHELRKVSPIQVECAAAAWAGSLDGRDVADRVADRVQLIPQKRGSKVIVCISHVAYELGMAIDVEWLLERLGSRDDVITLIDGAQAVGNIAVPESVLERAHFYAFSGHKWLLGDPTLGCLSMNRDRMAGDPMAVSEKLVAGRPFSYWRQRNTAGRQTIDMDPYITLNAMLTDFLNAGATRIDEHNTRLATSFRKWMLNLGVAQLPRIDQRGGIVPVIIRDAPTVAEKLYERTGFSAQPIRDDTALRFCFHYNISEWNVHRLTYELGQILYAPPAVEQLS